MKTYTYFRSYLAQFFLKLKIFRTNLYKNSKHTLHVQKLFFFENRAVYAIRCRNIVERSRPQMIIWLMCIACWISKATNAHAGCVVLSAFPLRYFLHESASVLRYMYFAYLFKIINLSHLFIEGGLKTQIKVCTIKVLI